MNELPQDAHPTAKAFFDALDEYNQQQEGGYQNIENNEDDAITKVAATATEKPIISESLKRKSQSLGWRNRNSQNEFYPASILQSLATSEDTDHASKEKESSTRLRRRNFSVQQVQRGEVEGTYGTGATVWPAAVVLIKYLERNNHDQIRKSKKDKDGKLYQDFCDDSVITLRGRHVIDLGGGTGITSIAAALLGAISVVCTDGEESVVRLARNNIRRASRELSVSFCSSQSELPDQRSHTTSMCDTEEVLSANSGDGNDDKGITATIDDCPIRAQKYWWGDGTSRNLLSGTKGNGLVILVADCVLPKLYPIAPLVQAIDECLRLHDDDEEGSDGLSSSFAIVSYEHRYFPEYDPRIEFQRLAYERCLDVFSVPREEMDPVYSLEDVEIWIVRRRRCR